MLLACQAPLERQSSIARRPKSAGFALQDGLPRRRLATRSGQTAAAQSSGARSRLVAASVDEADEIGRREPGGRGVLERMAIDLGEVHQRLVDHDDDLRRAIVDQRERRDRAWRHAEHGFEQLRACRS